MTTIDFYTLNCLQCSKITTRNYSTSFSTGIWLLKPSFHYPVYAIYGFVRYADEIVDTFFNQDQQRLFNLFKHETFDAIKQKFSINPILHSFQWVVNTYKIELSLIEAFLYSMELDLTIKTHTSESFKKYVYGSAEVVGLMCLRVFCNQNSSCYEKLYMPARKLGEAFQKINFLRDIRSDYYDRGRIYFPGIKPLTFDDEQKKLLENEIEQDFAEAEKGIFSLPAGSKAGVFIAFLYYRALTAKIHRITAHELMVKRYRISNFQKTMIMLKGFIILAFNKIFK